MKPLYVKKNGVVYKISGNGMPALYPAENVEYDNTVTSELQATDVQGAIDELSTRQGGVKNTAYGTCNTTGDVKDKVATLVDATNWILEVGTIVGVRFTYTNTYTPSSGNAVTLNVNNTGAKNIRYSDGIRTGTDDIKCPTAYGESGQTIYYMYDGTYWVWVSHSKDNDTLYNFEGNEFRSIDGNNYGHEIGYGGNANSIKVNGHYYYNSNGPSTAIGASANDGALYVQAFDSDYAVQIAQNYENGNIFVRGLNDGTWTDWKKPIANIAGNNTVLTTDKTPFLTRQTLNPTGFSGYVREKLIGCSVAWNQLVQNGNFADTSGWTAQRGTISASNNVLSYTLTEIGVADVQNRIEHYVDVVQGHKYLLSAKFKPAHTTTVGFRNSQVVATLGAIEVSNATFTQVSTIFNATATTSLNMYWVWVCGDAGYSVGDVNRIKECQIIDLTLAFGSTIADHLYGLSNNGGITKLRDMGCPIDKYTPYGYGLYSVKTSGKKIVGKNLLNGIYTNANTFIAEDGTTTTTSAGGWNLTDYIPVVGGTSITLNNMGGGSSPSICWYDSGKNYIGGSKFANTMPKTVALPDNARYIRTNVFRDSLNVAQIEIGTSATTYEPYSPITYPLGNDELRGKFDLVNGEIVASGDVKESNGRITRNYGIVDLGTLTWTYNEGGRGEFGAVLVGGKRSDSYISNPNARCSKYCIRSGGYDFAAADKSLGFADKAYSIECAVTVNDSDYTDAATFKTAMNGVYLVYELATPTTEQSTLFADPMSMVGATTEEYIDTRDIPCPVGAERQYMGQSEDVVEIPSSPLSDGKRVLVAETNNGNTVNYFGDLGLLFEDVSSKITKYHNTTVTNFNVLYAYKIGRLVSFSFRATISGDGYGRLATLDKSLLPKNPNYFLFNTITTTQGDYNLRGYFAGTNLDVAGLDSSISIDLAVNATYIT